MAPTPFLAERRFCDSFNKSVGGLACGRDVRCAVCLIQPLPVSLFSSSEEISWCVRIEGGPSSDFSLIERGHIPLCPIDDCERMLSTRSSSSSVPVVHRPNMHIDLASVSTTLSNTKSKLVHCVNALAHISCVSLSAVYLVYISGYRSHIHGPNMRSMIVRALEEV